MTVYQFGTSDLMMQMENNSFGAPVYVGEAKPGSADSAAVWRIKKLTYDANNGITNVQWANGSAEFKFVWDNRSGYAYS